MIFLAAIPLYLLLHHFVFSAIKKIVPSPILGRKHQVSFLAFGLLLPIIQELAHNQNLGYFGLIGYFWIIFIANLFIFLIIAQGFAMIFPKTIKIVYIIALTAALAIAIFMTISFSGLEQVPSLSSAAPIVLVLSFIFAMHYFMYFRLARGLQLSERYSGIIIILMAVNFTLFTSQNFIGNDNVIFGLFLFQGFLSFLLSVLIIEFYLSLIFKNYRKKIVSSMLTAALLLSLFAYFQGSSVPVIKEITVPIKNLSKELSGFKVVHLSDLHLNRLNLRWMEKTVKKVNSIDADLIVITGDLVDQTAKNEEKFNELLRSLKSKNGKYVVVGNHEYYSGIENFLENISKTDIKLLVNENIQLDNGIQIAGIDDQQASQYGRNGPDLSKAFENTDNSDPLILLSHRPDIFDEAVDKGVDLQLSGHTHAGQLPPLSILVNFYFKYPYGLYESNGSYLYTTSGTGYYSIPMRLFTQNEIVVITLIN